MAVVGGADLDARPQIKRLYGYIWMVTSVFPEALVREMHTRIQNKVLYGSDHPAIHVDRWWADWEEIAVNESITQKIFLDNAKRVLGIDDWPESK